VNTIRFVIKGIELDFWLERTPSVVTVMVKKASDTRSLEECEKYPVFSVTCNGELYRHSGLPVGWGFRLTKDRKIKEVR
jgi:hypothetical protein